MCALCILINLAFETRYMVMTFSEIVFLCAVVDTLTSCSTVCFHLSIFIAFCCIVTCGG